MIPNNEQSTIVLFAKLALEMGYTFKEIGTRCPDAILEKDGQVIRVEFEHKAKTFRAHKHNPDDVDLIICWEDNWPESPLPVLSLEKYVTLAEARSEPIDKPKPSLWQRFWLWYAHWQQEQIERKNTCSICGHQMDVRCDEIDWGTTNDDPCQWVTRHCSRCNRTEVSCMAS